MTTKTISSKEVQETLHLARQLGLKALPISKNSKATKEQGFQYPTYVTPWDRWKKEDLGIGLVLGGEKGIIDIDIDDPRITLVAAQVLPPTSWRYGRKSKKSSHFMYSSSTVADPAHLSSDEPVFPLKTEKYSHLANDPRKGKDPDWKPVILEFRGDGSQSVLPGTLHEDTGELVTWEAGRPTGLPPEIDPFELRKLVKMVAMVPLIADNAWHSGQRHDVALCLSGMMAGAKWKEQDALTIFDQVMKFSGEGERVNILRAISDTFKRYRQGKKIGGGPMLAELMGHDFLVNQFRKWFSDRITNAFEDYDAAYVTMMHFGAFTVVPRKHLDNVMKADFDKWKLADFHAVKCNEFVMVSNGEDGKKEKKTKLLKSKIFIEHPRRFSYTRTHFEPGSTEDVKDESLNLWRGWANKPDPGSSCARWLHHVKTYVCAGDEALYHWVMSWCADIVQDPQAKPGTALVMCSKEGTGKNSFVEGLWRAVGKRYYREMSHPDQLTSKYNDQLQYALLVFANETTFAKDPKSRPILNALATDSEFQLEKKFGDSRMETNYVRLVMASNKHHVVEKSTTDRRFTVVDVKSPEDDPDVDVEKYFTELMAEIRGDGPKALLAYLQAYKYKKWAIRRPHETEAGRRQALLSLSPAAQFWGSCLNDGRIPVQEEDEPGLPPHGSGDWHEKGWPSWVSKPALENAFMNSKFHRRDGPAQFWLDFYEKAGIPNKTVKRTTSEGRKNTVTLPPLNEAIELFNQRCPGAVSMVEEIVEEVTEDTEGENDELG